MLSLCRHLYVQYECCFYYTMQIFMSALGIVGIVVWFKPVVLAPSFVVFLVLAYLRRFYLV